MAAGLATLSAIDEPGFYELLAGQTRTLVDGIARAAAENGIPLTSVCEGGMFGLVFTEERAVHRFEQIANANVDRFKRFFHGMLDQGIYLAPSALEAGFVSAAHGDDEIGATVDAAKRVFAAL